MKVKIILSSLVLAFVAGCATIPPEYQEKISGDFGPSQGDVILNSIGMKLVYIQAGDFMMGSGLSPSQVSSQFGGNADWYKDEHPQHKVKISEGFWIGQTEVTQAQYRAVMDTNPSNFKGDNNPVEQVNWSDAMEFCKKLSQKEIGRTYTLPTEAQWEYACRAGTSTVFSFGNSESSLGDYAWYKSNSNDKTHPVGQKRPNDFGLYDMHGNVWEWCRDWYDSGYYNKNIITDPENKQGDSNRVLRGGCWDHTPVYFRSAERARFDTDSRYNNSGFRVVLSVSSQDFQ
jgi:formylglycine-generating enzyme required for sulfatase activity